jgi:hypothetical protein
MNGMPYSSRESEDADSLPAFTRRNTEELNDTQFYRRLEEYMSGLPYSFLSSEDETPSELPIVKKTD